MEDCALVFDAIHGADGIDETAGSYQFQWPSQKDISSLRIGYRKSRRRNNDERIELRILQELGCELVEIELPKNLPINAMFNIINIEAASVFDDLMRDGHTEGFNTWDESFRAAQYISAVDYVRIQRARSILRKEYAESIKDVDAIVNMRDLLYTNFTGHPSIVMPVGYDDLKDGARRPQTAVLSGHLNDDERLLALGHAFQKRLTAHHEHPNLDPWLRRYESGTLDQKKSS